MYKTNYKQVLKAEGITEEDLIPKTAAILADVKQLEAAAKEEEDENKLEEINSVLQSLDAALCKKIKKNNYYKVELPVKLAAGREAKKGAKTFEAKKEPIVAPIVEPVIETKEDEPVEEKKSSGFGWLLGTVLGAATFALVGKRFKWF